MINEIEEWNCKVCGKKRLIAKRIMIWEAKNGDVFWILKCGACGDLQNVHVMGQGE